jgi:methyl-accepting chemotaxis protein
VVSGVEVREVNVMLCWVNNLKLGTKIICLVVLEILFVFMVGGFGLYYIKLMGDEADEMYSKYLIGVQKTEQVRANIIDIKAKLYRMMITQESAEKSQLFNEIMELRREDNKLMSFLEKNCTDKEYQVIFAKTLIDLKNFRVVQNNIIELAKENKNKEAYDYFRKNEYQQLAVKDSLNSLALCIENLAKSKNEANKKHEQSIFIMFIFMITISAIIGLVLGIMMAKWIAFRLNTAVVRLTEIANGNLSLPDLKIRAKDEIGAIGVALNIMNNKLKSLIQEVISSTEEVTAGAEEISAAVDNTTQGTSQVATSTSQLAAGCQEEASSVESGFSRVNAMSEVINKISNNVINVVKLTDTAKEEAEHGHSEADSAVKKINQIKTTALTTSKTADELRELGSEIEKIVDLIKGIASQTNLLALNAAIEAARAGEQGKGFAVVADEVKKLANKSSDATDTIIEMVKEIQNKTHVVVKEMNKGVTEIEDGVIAITNVGNALKTIVSSVNQVKTHSDEVAEMSESLTLDASTIVSLMGNITTIIEETTASAEEISSITEEQSASMEEINASLRSLATLAENLNAEVSYFKV